MASKKTKQWTQTGAARFAREARIATVQHLATAEAARTWHMTKLVHAFNVHMANFRDRGAAATLLFGGMGYTPPYPGSLSDATELIVSDEARHLAVAEIYILSPEMCDVVVAAAQTLTLQDLQSLDEDDIAGRSGLVVLPHPLLVRSIGGDLADDRAYAWNTPGRIAFPDPNGGGIKELPAVRVSTYHDSYGPVRPDSFLEFTAEARRQGTPLPPLLLDAIRCFPFRFPDEADVTAVDRLAEAAQRVDGAMREAAASQGLDEDRVEGEYVPGTEIVDSDDTFTTRFLYAFWRLCEQRIAVLDNAPVNHSARLMAERATVSPDVRVVRLRQRDDRPEGQANDRQWQHRWVVRMHKVRQWYPSEQRHKVIYRGPYVKGPAGKPLLASETVHALVR
jgi:hypothetical protein